MSMKSAQVKGYLDSDIRTHKYPQSAYRMPSQLRILRMQIVPIRIRERYVKCQVTEYVVLSGTRAWVLFLCDTCLEDFT
jgi:hypothetical protein